MKHSQFRSIVVYSWNVENNLQKKLSYKRIENLRNSFNDKMSTVFLRTVQKISSLSWTSKNFMYTHRTIFLHRYYKDNIRIQYKTVTNRYFNRLKSIDSYFFKNRTFYIKTVRYCSVIIYIRQET